jgi:hypothetical protein
MRSNAPALDRPGLGGQKASTTRARAGADQRRRVPVKRAHLVFVLLAVTVIALMVRPGWGTGAEASCGATAVSEFACLEGQLPQEQAGRSCVVHRNVYGTTFWRCARDR